MRGDVGDSENEVDGECYVVLPRIECCRCVMLSGSRVCPEAVEPHLPALSLALRSSLADTSWPIRDTAATAVGRFLRYNGLKLAPSFFCSPSSSETRDSRGEGEGGVRDKDSMQEVVGDMLGLLFACLQEDPFRPVRESAAVGLVDICLHDDVGECVGRFIML